MAKPELRDHRKFLKLKRLLGAPTPHVMGYLECLWLRGYQTGNPVVGDSLDVESAAEYPGEIGTFTKAALDAGFLDLGEDGRYSIHDLFEHAPSYAKKRMVRKGTGAWGSEESESEIVRADTKPAKSSPRGRKKGDSESARPLETRTNNQEPRTENSPPSPSGGEAERPPTDLPTPAEPEKPPRPRNLLFDAVAEITAMDVSMNGTKIGTLTAKLANAKPPYTPEEVHEFGRRFGEICPWGPQNGRMRPTLNEIREHIGKVRAKPPPAAMVPHGKPQTRGQAELDFAARMAADAFGGSP